MKIIVIILVICVLTILGQNYEMKYYRLCLDKQYKEHCIRKYRPKSDRVTLIEGNKLTRVSMSEREGCYVSCMLLKNQVMEANGKLNVTRITRSMSPDTVRDIKDLIEFSTKCSRAIWNDTCMKTANVFYDIINTLEHLRLIKFTVVYKDSAVYEEYKSCGQPFGRLHADGDSMCFVQSKGCLKDIKVQKQLEVPR